MRLRVQEFGLSVEHSGLAAGRGAPRFLQKHGKKGGIETYSSLHELRATHCLKITVVVSLNPRLEHAQLCRHQIGTLCRWFTSSPNIQTSSDVRQ